MSKIDDMALFVQVAKSGGLAAAGRKLGLSPASMTARMNQIEQRYQTRLLNRNTRQVSLTDAGQRFYQGCLRVLDEVAVAEATLSHQEAAISGTLRVTAPSDFGRQYVAPALTAFASEHPDVMPHLNLTDGNLKLVDEGIDLAIRLGNLPDSTLVARPLVQNRRVLCASPVYLEKAGTPDTPAELAKHRCLVMEWGGLAMDEWYFTTESGQSAVRVRAAMTSTDGAMIRQWAVDGCGIAMKSWWDVRRDVLDGRLMLLFDDQVIGLNRSDAGSVGIHLVYPGRKFQPRPVQAFTAFLLDWMETL
ncbi:LysR family transcriptional regulator (plasmid) [Photobacterium sp. GJ3]|uniref:LysR family transcriptional regulator n=1 Tax=Photobacterium sp. GJ3 TaxID=2829502 RepID=UPI001B8AC3A4|nr:LysR family transcriptional regulator [Photobacterium sp. GJ3]QUJ69852.1 LysR family transcriptional regulator [Photobacterium sp. GJ3]